MRGWEKAALWTFILLVCAGVGAFVASRSNPFPPEVRGSSPSVGETPSPSIDGSVRWRLTMTSRTTHAYRVGGSCTSDWRMRTRIRVLPGGRVRGAGTARLVGAARCDFETVQVQAETVRIGIAGRRRGELLAVRLGVLDVSPRGAQDLGGFVGTIPVMRLSLEEREGAEARVPTRVEDANGDTFVAQTDARLSA